MLPATQVKVGQVILYNGEPCRVVKTLHITPGNWRGMVQMKLVNIKTGTGYENRFRSEDKLDLAPLEEHNLKYLYHQGDEYHFMNNESYDMVMLSLFESLSIVAMEAWLMGTPTLLNGRCEVLEYQSRQSNGGLYYYSYEEFASALTMLLDHDDLRAQLGRQGRAFVIANYSWDVILAKYRAVLETLTDDTPRGRDV